MAPTLAVPTGEEELPPTASYCSVRFRGRWRYAPTFADAVRLEEVLPRGSRERREGPRPSSVASPSRASL